MLRFLLTLSFIAGIFCFTYGQQPQWQAKLVVEHPVDSTIKDSIRIGCDSAGARGYQAQLDSVDTTAFRTPLAIRGYDSLVADSFNTSCPANMRRDIRAFKDGSKYELGPKVAIKYPFWVMSDTIVNDASLKLKLDTSALFFENKEYKLTGVSLYSSGGYIDFIDKDKHILLNTDDDSSLSIRKTYLKILAESNVPTCLQDPTHPGNENGVYLELWVTFNVYPNVNGVFSSKTDSTKIIVYPNPNSGNARVKFKELFTGRLKIYDMQGRLVQERRFVQAREGRVGLRKGKYVFRFFNQKDKLIKTQKVLSR